MLKFLIKFISIIYLLSYIHSAQAEDVKAGEALTTENLRCVRPGMGLPPKYFDMLLGRRVNRDVKKGTPMQWELLG